MCSYRLRHLSVYWVGDAYRTELWARDIVLASRQRQRVSASVTNKYTENVKASVSEYSSKNKYSDGAFFYLQMPVVVV